MKTLKLNKETKAVMDVIFDKKENLPAEVMHNNSTTTTLTFPSGVGITVPSLGYAKGTEVIVKASNGEYSYETSKVEKSSTKSTRTCGCSFDMSKHNSKKSIYDLL